MAKKKKVEYTEPTHFIVEVPSSEGTYINPEGERVNLTKIPIEKNVSTRHKVHRGTTIKQFLKSRKDYQTAK